MRRILQSLIVLLLILTQLSTIEVYANDNYTITSFDTIVYTLDGATLYSTDGDVVLPSMDAGLPLLVKGVTSTGYYLVEIASIDYLVIPSQVIDKNYNLEVYCYNTIIAQMATLPEGMIYNNSTYYGWKGGIYIGGFGCAAFTFYLSDLVFGDAPARITKDYSNIKIGDILRVNNNTHSVIVIGLDNDYVTVAEANYYGKVHWGRKLSYSEIYDSKSYIITRY